MTGIVKSVTIVKSVKIVVRNYEKENQKEVRIHS